MSAVSTPSPFGLLHRHALESILGFFWLSELAELTSVSREFAAAAASMKALEATVASSPQSIAAMCHSKLARHVEEAGDPSLPCPLDMTKLALLAQRMINLQLLRCSLRGGGGDGGQVQFPARLRELHLRIQSASVSEVDSCLAALARLPHLFHLTLSTAHSAAMSVDLLRPAPSLRELCIRDLTDPKQIDKLISFDALTWLDLGAVTLLTRLRDLSPRPRVSWTELGRYLTLTDELAELLPLVPSLTYLVCGCPCKIDFLPALPALEVLDLRLFGCKSSNDELVSAIQSCQRLRALRLHGSTVSREQLSTVLASLQQLTRFELSTMYTLDSFDMFRAPATQDKLAVLSMQNCPVPGSAATVMQQLHGLRALKQLTVERCFSNHAEQTLAEPAMQLYTVPSSVFPQLERFSYEEFVVA